MNKKKLVIIIIAAVLILAIAASAFYIFFGPGDFRRAKWGMSMDQVKARESGDPLVEEYASLSYPLDKLEGFDVDGTVFYKFDSSNDKLTHVSIGLTSETFGDKMVSRLVETMEEKYGEPVETEDSEILYNYTWTTERTKISVTKLSGYTLIIYSDVTIPVEE